MGLEEVGFLFKMFIFALILMHIGELNNSQGIAVYNFLSESYFNITRHGEIFLLSKHIYFKNLFCFGQKQVAPLCRLFLSTYKHHERKNQIVCSAPYGRSSSYRSTG